jgi:hypothetical protein
LEVFENRIIRSISGPKRDELTGGRKELHNEKLHRSYSSHRMIKSRRQTGNAERMGNMRNAVRKFGWKALKE